MAAEALTDQLFAAAGIESYSRPANPASPGYFTYTDPQTGKTSAYEFHGSGHIVGTCRMGASKGDSVVDRNQRSWDHANLYITGSSVFPTVATGNPSLTIAALAFWAADNVLGQLGP